MTSPSFMKGNILHNGVKGVGRGPQGIKIRSKYYLVILKKGKMDDSVGSDRVGPCTVYQVNS